MFGFATDHDMIDARNSSIGQYVGKQGPKPAFHPVPCDGVANFLGDRDALPNRFRRDGVVTAAAMREQDKIGGDESFAAIGSEKIGTFANHFDRSTGNGWYRIG